MIKASDEFKTMLDRLLFCTGNLAEQRCINTDTRRYYSQVWECLQRLRDIIELGIVNEYIQTKEEFRAELIREDKEEGEIG